MLTDQQEIPILNQVQPSLHKSREEEPSRGSCEGSGRGLPRGRGGKCQPRDNYVACLR